MKGTGRKIYQYSGRGFSGYRSGSREYFGSSSLWRDHCDKKDPGAGYHLGVHGNPVFRLR